MSICQVKSTACSNDDGRYFTTSASAKGKGEQLCPIMMINGGGFWHVVFPCAPRRANAAITNRTGAPAATRTVSYLSEKLVDVLLTLHCHQRIARCINVCSFDCRIDWML
jgi:hypothetical protein